MNVNCLNSSAENVGYSGNVLSTEQIVVLQNSLSILQVENHFKQVFLWGQIYGQQSDYFVAFGYEKDILFQRKFFYSSNLKDWGLLPCCTHTSRCLTEICGARFTGDPAEVIQVQSEHLLDEEAHMKGGGDMANYSPETFPLKEEDRLSAAVDLINQECAVVPRGALLKQTEGRVVENIAFDGLSHSDACQLKFYLHYYQPIQTWGSNLLNHADYNYAYDFLDPICLDQPSGCWIQQYENGGRLTILRNLKWPGMTFYHQIRTPHHGFLYIGNGLKNFDVPFMI